MLSPGDTRVALTWKLRLPSSHCGEIMENLPSVCLQARLLVFSCHWTQPQSGTYTINYPCFQVFGLRVELTLSALWGLWSWTGNTLSALLGLHTWQALATLNEGVNIFWNLDVLFLFIPRVKVTMSISLLYCYLRGFEKGAFYRSHCCAALCRYPCFGRKG